MKIVLSRFFVVLSVCFMLFGAGAHSLYADVLSPNGLQIEPATLPDGMAGELYYLPGLFKNPTITVTGGTGAISLTVTSGFLPPSLRVDNVYGDETHFVIGYEPSTPGVFTFTLTAQDQNGQTASREYSVRISPAANLKADDVVSSGDHTCTVTYYYVSNFSGRKWCWGLNSYGQLGNNLTENNPFPVRGEATGYLSHDGTSATGYEHTCTGHYHHGGGAWSDYCVGRNQFGQLLAPYHWGGMMMVARLNQTCGIYIDGLECWGWNAYGQLGNGTYTNTNEYSITQVVGLTSGVQHVALGDFHACALVSGAVKCWGRNNHGQLGIGLSGDTSNVPLSVIGLPDGITQLAAGTEHSCAITTSGEAWCWGNNNHGQLGDGTTIDRALPVRVLGLDGRMVSVVAGAEHTCAWLDTGKVKCWGGGERGQLGNGAWADSLSPVTVSLPNSFHVAQITSGGSHMCARSTAGNVSCWGWNYAGQLGNGTFENANAPMPVVGMGNNQDFIYNVYLPNLAR